VNHVIILEKDTGKVVRAQSRNLPYREEEFREFSESEKFLVVFLETKKEGIISQLKIEKDESGEYQVWLEELPKSYLKMETPRTTLKADGTDTVEILVKKVLIEGTKERLASGSEKVNIIWNWEKRFTITLTGGQGTFRTPTISEKGGKQVFAVSPGSDTAYLHLNFE